MSCSDIEHMFIGFQSVTSQSRCFKLQQLHAFISILVDLCTQTRLELGMEIRASQEIHGDPWRSHVGHLNLTESSTASMVAEREKPKPV